MIDTCDAEALDYRQIDWLRWARLTCHRPYGHQGAHRSRHHMWTDPMPYETPENTP